MRREKEPWIWIPRKKMIDGTPWMDRNGSADICLGTMYEVELEEAYMSGGFNAMEKTKIVDHSKFCEQCDASCIACGYGDVHMNTDPHPIANPSPTECQTHNQKGHHHVLWNGSSNETHACGSAQCNALALKNMEWRVRDAQIKEEEDLRTEANRRQIGGSHYGLGQFQHWDMVDLFHLDYFQGQITKYVVRWRDKNGIEDLEKAKHYLEKYIAIENRKIGIVDEIPPVPQVGETK